MASVVAAALLIALSACASTRSPNATAPTSADAPADLGGIWTGTGTDPQGPETFRWTLTQSGGALTGMAVMDSANPTDGSCGSCHKQKVGTLSGSIVGTALTLTLDFPEGGADITPLCGLRMTAAAPDVTTRRIAATYTGTTTCEGPIAGGTLLMAR